MGRQKLQSLLDGMRKNVQALEENTRQDIENSAKIYAVAQYATNQMVTAADTVFTEVEVEHLLLPAQAEWTWERLKKKYSSFNKIRAALKHEKGVSFSKTPTKEQLVDAWNDSSVRISPEQRIHILEMEVQYLKNVLHKIIEFTGVPIVLTSPPQN